MNIQERLAAMGKDWDNAKREATGESVPADEYTAQLSKVVLRESKSSGNLFVAREHVITDGSYSGATVRDMIHFEASEYGMVQLIKWLAICGIEIDTPNDLPEALESVMELEPICTINVTCDGTFTNVEVLGVLHSGAKKQGSTKSNVKSGTSTDEEAPVTVPADSEENDPTVNLLKELYASQGIDFSPTATLADLIDIGKEYEFYLPGADPEIIDEDCITEDDAAVLLSVGLSSSVKKPVDVQKQKPKVRAKKKS